MKERRDHVAWHQIVRNMIAQEAVSFLSIMWQCQRLKNTGYFACFRNGFMLPLVNVAINPLSFPAQQRAYSYMFANWDNNPQAIAREIETWVDARMEVRFMQNTQVAP